MKSKIGYRVWQFWKSCFDFPGEKEFSQVKEILSPAEMDLFQQLPTPDKNHSLRVLNSLKEMEEVNPDLLKAALLHDVGKTVYPLTRLGRVFAVLMFAFFPRLAASWGTGEPAGLKRPLVIVKQHPGWGADLAGQAGSSELVIWLIRYHEQDKPLETKQDQAILLLKKLQEVDNRN